MPELPEVESIRRELVSCILDSHFSQVKLLWERAVIGITPDGFCHQLEGKRICHIGRRGKYLLFSLSDKKTFILHLGMSGYVELLPSSSPTGHYTVAVFYLDGERKLQFCDRRRLGKLWLTTNRDDVIGKLGIEPFDPRFTPEVLAHLVQRRMPIKAFLLDQHAIAGIGNMYADEILFSSRIHPLKRVSSLTSEEVSKVYDSIQRVLAEALGERGASVSTYRLPCGSLGRAQFHFRVAHRGGQPCPRCGSEIQRLLIQGRGTYFCPYCQKDT